MIYFIQEDFMMHALGLFDLSDDLARLSATGDPLDDIIQSFNERWFQGWSATPEEQRVKFVNLADSIKAHPDFEAKYQNNSDKQNRELAFKKIFEDVMLKNRRYELELYKLLTNEPCL